MTNSNNNKIVVLIDMDCFFCQVETKLKPEYFGKPLAVVQYNQWQLGGIIAVNYEARDYGVTRHMRGQEAKEKCPDLILASVPCLRGKADTSRYRSAGREVIDVIRKHCNVIERASVDEAYLDITDMVDKRMSTNNNSLSCLVRQLSNTFVVGYSEVGKNNEEERSEGITTWIKNIFEELQDVQAQKLAIAGAIVEEIRADIFDKTGFRCSAGIAQNKILAKLACGLHKPNRQTILPASAVSELYSKLPVKKVRNLGGKFGEVVVESLNCNVMGDLLQYSLQYLQNRFDEKTGLWLYNIARGIDNEPVTIRLVSKSIGACKKFPGKQAITSVDVLRHWAGELSAEVCERLEQDLEENERRATLVTICYHYYQNKTTISQSRSCTLNSYKPEKMANRCVDIISKHTQCPIAYLGISAGKFIPAKGSEKFRNFFNSNKIKHLETDSETMTNLELDKIINVNSNNGETKETSNDCEGLAQNSRVNVVLNEQHPNMEISSSPTSRKLDNLINSLNERNERKELRKKKSDRSNINDSLHQNDFKESFFMNAFNAKESRLKDTLAHDIELSDNKIMDVKIEDSNRSSENDNSDGKLDLNAKENNCKEYTNKEIEKGPSSSSVGLNDDVTITVQNSIKLEEIFPDLNNIDWSVVALLPPSLQAEAKLYIKAQNKKTITKETVVKTSKGKTKSKTNTLKGKRSNDISNFLIKQNSLNLIKIPSKECLKCHQMIPVSRYEEHCDFHLAESLQWEVNRSILQTANVKRKDNIDDASTSSIKRRPSGNILNSHKSSESITTFLS